MAILQHVLIAEQDGIEVQEIQHVKTVQQVRKNVLFSNFCHFFVLSNFIDADQKYARYKIMRTFFTIISESRFSQNGCVISGIDHYKVVI